MNVHILALIAMIPAITGPLPEQKSFLTTTLCSGGAVIKIDIPISGKDRLPSAPCRGKACHAGTCRKKFDRDQ